MFLNKDTQDIKSKTKISVCLIAQDKWTSLLSLFYKRSIL